MVSLTGRVSTFFKNNLLLYLLLLLQHSSKFWKKLDTKFRIGRDHVSRKLITVCSRLYDLPKETKLCANIFLRQKNLAFGRFKFKQYRYFQKIIVNNNIILPLLYYQFTNYLQVTRLRMLISTSTLKATFIIDVFLVFFILAIFATSFWVFWFLIATFRRRTRSYTF